MLKSCGAVAVGFARSEKIESTAAASYHEWLQKGYHAGMDYLSRHEELRKSPESVMPGASTIICCAFSYHNPDAARKQPYIASYALYDDYHDLLRDTLKGCVDNMKEIFGGEFRICIDSAPIPERYWAMKAGIGRMGDNGMIIIDGVGSMVFIALLATDLNIPPDTPSDRECHHCGRCITECPTGALENNGLINCNRCISYLTIEHKGEWSANQREIVKKAFPEGIIFGCDVCLKVCPYNQSEDIPERVNENTLFTPRDEIISLTPEIIATLSQEEFSATFRRSPLKRGKLAGIKRNVSK